MQTGKELGMTVLISAQDSSRMSAQLDWVDPAMPGVQIAAVNGFELVVHRLSMVAAQIRVSVEGFTFRAELEREQMQALTDSLRGRQAPAPIQMSCYDEALRDYIRIDADTVATQPVYFVNESNPGILLSASGTAISE